MIFLKRAWKLDMLWIEQQPIGDINKMYHDAIKEIEERNKSTQNN